MKFYSEKTKKLYDSEELLTAGEKELADKEAEKAKLAETRKARAEEVEASYKNFIDVKKKAMDEIKAAENGYLEKKNAFINDFGSYHITYSRTGDRDVVTVSDIVDSMFNNFFIW